MTTRVLLCHDHSLTREGLRLILDRCEEIDVVGEAACAREAAAAADCCRPHVAVIGASDGALLDVFAAVSAVRGRLPEARAVIVSNSRERATLYEAARCGFAGFVLDDMGGDDLHRAVRAVAAGGVFLAPSMASRVLADALKTYQGPRDPEILPELTHQEADVLRLLASGYSNSEIGGAMFLSEATIKTHLTHVFRKLEVRDRVQAVIRAYDAGLVTPGRAAPESHDERRSRAVHNLGRHTLPITA